MVELYLSTKSIVMTQQQYVRHFHCRDPPSKRVILYNVKRFRDNGTVQNLNKNHSGRARGAVRINACMNRHGGHIEHIIHMEDRH